MNVRMLEHMRQQQSVDEWYVIAIHACTVRSQNTTELALKKYDLISRCCYIDVKTLGIKLWLQTTKFVKSLNVMSLHQLWLYCTLRMTVGSCWMDLRGTAGNSGWHCAQTAIHCQTVANTLRLRVLDKLLLRLRCRPLRTLHWYLVISSWHISLLSMLLTLLVPGKQI